ncbi:MAG: RsmB/NOP family class I SAM-dependent RNA methyltransferase [Euryarchaeota archaeon]|jgi:16S rRNA C967 or C1407 C5-methylase (RsmB/RsmF family)|nr:RsmB/NOP family class I SAM-dependent RNA methyltransferase [Euryarchaeota archaeon]MBT4982009.1 RsmB/NOP family class I SAM-dependent RNA methyltransferase [Euryarchaeota archaeon]
MVRPADEELIQQLAVSPLSGLSRSLGIDVGKWLPVASSPLPVTLRVTPRRHDIGWTRRQLESVGGQRIPWMVMSESWVMPFSKGDYPSPETKKLMMVLHETGRITRQEAVSMLPPVVLEPEEDDLVMDTCAAPGSKATQLAEAIPKGLVLANEPSSGRLNLLVTNRGRLGIENMLIMQHDGRHIGRMPSPGIDGIVVDAPCSGTATTRKNRELWHSWTPRVGRSLFKLQVDISFRAAQLLRPGGRMVYSTCSLDPIENEAVVCEILQKCPWLELIEVEAERLFPSLIHHKGIDNWPILDEESNVVDWSGQLPKLPGLSEEMLNPKQRGTEAPNLSSTIRVHQHDNDTGGFFVALFEHVAERTPEGVARSMILKRKLNRDPVELPRQNKNRHTTNIAPPEVIANICEHWGIDESLFSWWHRGKRVNLSTINALEKLYNPKIENSKGDFWPGNDFHPLRVIHVGQPAFTDNKGIWRTRQEALELLRPHITKGLVDIDEETMLSMIRGDVPLTEEFPVPIERGSAILRCGEYLLPVWVAARVSLMIDDKEQEILRLKLGVILGDEEE